MVHVLKGLSGFVWSDVGGLNIGAAEEDAFKIYVIVSLFLRQHLPFFFTNSNRQKNPKASSYKNKGFAHYDQMAPLMPDKVCGTYTFHPSSQTRGAASLAAGTRDEALDDNDDHDDLPGDTLDNDGINELDDDGFDNSQPAPSQPTGSPAPSSTGNSNVSSKSKHSALDDIPSSSSTRYSASQAPSSSSKKPRVSTGAVALQGINASMASFSDSVRELAVSRAQGKNDTSPKRRERAARVVEEKEKYSHSKPFLPC